MQFNNLKKIKKNLKTKQMGNNTNVYIKHKLHLHLRYKNKKFSVELICNMQSRASGRPKHFSCVLIVYHTVRKEL